MAKFLTEKQVKRLATAIQENKSDAEVGQILMPMMLPLMNKIFLFSEFSKKIPSTATAFQYATREGWTLNSQESKNYDFLGLKGLGFLSEQFHANQILGSEFEYNVQQLETTLGVQGLQDKIVSLIEQEFPNVVEKHILNMLYDAVDNGVAFLGNEDTTANPNAHPVIQIPSYNVAFDSEENIKASLFLLKQVINRLQKIDNPLTLNPTPSDYVLLIDTDIFPYLEQDAAFQLFGGDGALKLWLGNAPIGTISQMPVIKHPKMRSHTPIMIIKKEMLFLHLSPNVYTRNDFIAKSTKKRFFKIDKSFDSKISYWNAKFEGMHVFKLATTASVLNVLSTFKAVLREATNTAADGSLNVDYRIKGGAAAQVITVKNFDNFGYEIGTSSNITLDANGEATGTIAITGLDSGTYCVKLFHANGAKLEWTDNILVSNKNVIAERKIENQADLKNIGTIKIISKTKEPVKATEPVKA